MPHTFDLVRRKWPGSCFRRRGIYNSRFFKNVKPNHQADFTPHGTIVGVLFAITVPPANERGPHYLRPLLEALHAASAARTQFSLLVSTWKGSVGVFARVPPELQITLSRGLPAHYDGCHLLRLHDDALEFSESHRFRRQLYLQPDTLPLRTDSDFDDQLNRHFADPMAGILALLSEAQLPAQVELKLNPISAGRRRQATRVEQRVQRGASSRYRKLATSPRRIHRMAAWFVRLIPRRSTQPSEKLDGRVLFEVVLELTVGHRQNALPEAQRLMSALTAAFDSFGINGKTVWKSKDGKWSRGWLASVVDVSLLWHPMTESVRATRLRQTRWRELEPPVRLPSKDDEGASVIGETAFGERKDPVCVLEDDRLRHTVLIGRSGTGKTSLALNWMLSDIEAGRGILCMDPHGDLINDILDRLPDSRINDVLLFDPADPSLQIGFNPLQCHNPDEKPLVADGVLSAFRKVFGLSEQYSPRLLYILRNALLTVLEDPNPSLIDLDLILSNPQRRKRYIERLPAGPLLSFWRDEFLRWNERYRTESVAAILNKVKPLILSPVLARIFAPQRSCIDLLKLINEQKVVLVNLSRGRLGSDASSLLGSLLISSLEVAAHQRIILPVAERTPFHIFIDEAATVATDALISQLSEARKMGLSYTLLLQFAEQLPPEILKSVYGNVGTLIALGLGNSKEAEYLSDQFGGRMTATDLLNLPRYHAYIRLLFENDVMPAFSMRTLPPALAMKKKHREKVIRQVQRCWVREHARDVEDRLAERYR